MWGCRTVTDVQMENNVLGLVVAGLSVVSSGMQQIFCRTMQQKHNLSSHELLSNTAPAQVLPLPSPPCSLHAWHALRTSQCTLLSGSLQL